MRRSQSNLQNLSTDNSTSLKVNFTQKKNQSSSVPKQSIYQKDNEQDKFDFIKKSQSYHIRRLNQTQKTQRKPIFDQNYSQKKRNSIIGKDYDITELVFKYSTLSPIKDNNTIYDNNRYKLPADNISLPFHNNNINPVIINNSPVVINNKPVIINSSSPFKYRNISQNNQNNDDTFQHNKYNQRDQQNFNQNQKILKNNQYICQINQNISKDNYDIKQINKNSSQNISQKLTYSNDNKFKNNKINLDDLLIKYQASKYYLKNKINPLYIPQQQVMSNSNLCKNSQQKQWKNTKLNQVNSLQKYQKKQYKILDKNLRSFIDFEQDQLNIIQKEQQFKQLSKDILNEFNIKMKIQKNNSIIARCIIKSSNNLYRQYNDISDQYYKIVDKQILFRNHLNLQSIKQNGYCIFRSIDDINKIKGNHHLGKYFKFILKKVDQNYIFNYYDINLRCYFLYQDKLSIQSIFKYFYQKNLQIYQLYLFLPSNDKQAQKQFLISVFKQLDNDFIKKQNFHMTIIIPQQINEIKMKQLLSFMNNQKSYKQKTKIWYAKIKQKCCYYSEEGNKLINQYYNIGLDYVELNNNHLNLQHITHTIDFKRNVIIYLQNNKQFPIKIYKNKITIKLNNQQKIIPQSEYQKIPKDKNGNMENCLLSIGYYKIIFNQQKQINLFSNYERKISYFQQQNTQNHHQLKLNSNLRIEYNYQIPSLIMQHPQQNQDMISYIKRIIIDLLSQKLYYTHIYLNKQFFVKIVQNRKDINNPITQKLYKSIQLAKQVSVKIQLDKQTQSIKITSYNNIMLEQHKHFIQKTLNQIQNITKLDLIYPKYWKISQSQDLYIHLVSQRTVQFYDIQKIFTAGKITQLIRIQNKTVYHKFYQQKMLLKHLNNNQNVKQMHLFHGTSKTNPKIIYQDKQQCFNINYSSQKNLLGRGIYFAERSEYSDNRYAYLQQKVQSEGDKDKNVYSMFYCLVMVGESQKCKKRDNNIKDTSYKNQEKKLKYESMTDFLQGSNVYVIYKSNRAYPLYLIKYVKK